MRIYNWHKKFTSIQKRIASVLVVNRRHEIKVQFIAEGGEKLEVVMSMGEFRDLMTKMRTASEVSL